MQSLSKVGLAPHVYGQFEDGLVMEMLPGTTVRASTWVQEGHMERMMHCIAALHNAESEELEQLRLTAKRAHIFVYFDRLLHLGT